ncbi:AraC family transcriptional regulator [Azospirillum agricola]|uniref:AraC family transcriptional regulator n=1 Tax=Azospirillum agricola TaxID=1720247 RepID=UPI000A0F2057|nr:GyrI-like domain-containing protein [Azospirillum agricola]SMH56596.1 DNA gyrase inhibitor GyrI [Azospirillum lipoferum]
MVDAERGFRNGEVRIVAVPDIRVAVLEHRGDPALIGESIRRFIAWRKAVALPPRLGATLNILYDDPLTTPPAAFRLDLCAATDRAIEPNDAGVVVKTIPGGRCAVLSHTGSEESLRAAILHLCMDWLPSSGEQRRDFPLYCQRIAFFPEVPEDAAVTDLFLPIR